MKYSQLYKTIPTHETLDVLAFDPGLTIGWAAFAPNGYPFATGEIRDAYSFKEATLGRFIRWMFIEAKPKPRVIVCEDLIVRPGGEMNGQRVIASEVIGVVRTYATLYSIELVMSPSSNLTMGLKKAGITMPKNHNHTHVPSAIAHGTFYVCEQEIRPVLPEASGYRQVSMKDLKRRD